MSKVMRLRESESKLLEIMRSGGITTTDAVYALREMFASEIKHLQSYDLDAKTAQTIANHLKKIEALKEYEKM